MEYYCNIFELNGGKIMARCDMAVFATYLERKAKAREQAII